MDVQELARANLETRIAANPYPGRGLVLGLGETGERLIQAYWIMGRSPNSRNRVFATDGNSVWTEAADAEQCADPSLIIYNAMLELKGVFVVTNGDQTDTIVRALVHGGNFEQALATRAYEPDAPNFTPRISGMFDLRLGRHVAKLCVLRKSRFGDETDRLLWHFEHFGPGIGHCITTYMGDGKPLPAFEGEPYLLPLTGDVKGIAQGLWAALNEDNRISLAVKAIDPSTLDSELFVINKYQRKP